MWFRNKDRVIHFEYRCLFSFVMNFFAESGKNIYCFPKSLEKFSSIWYNEFAKMPLVAKKLNGGCYGD